MNRFSCLDVVVMMALTLGGAANLDAQPYGPTQTPDSGITGSGTETLLRQPEILRMQIQLSAKGKNAEEALAKLKSLRENVKQKVEKLGPVAESVSIGAPKIAGADSSQGQMQRMVRQQLQGGGKKKSDDKMAPVSVTATLKAEWKLDGADADSMIVSASELQAKIEAADLAGSKESKEASEEEEEEASEEAQSMRFMENMYSGQGGAAPGMPSFTYVAMIPTEDVSKALKAAFAKAKQNAERTAEATGEKLGALRSATHMAVGVGENDPYGQMRMYMDAGRGVDKSKNDTEATSATAGELTYRITVTANFGIQRSKGD